MDIVDYACNAIRKDGRKTYLCEKTFGHVAGGDLDHQSGDFTWRDSPW